MLQYNIYLGTKGWDIYTVQTCLLNIIEGGKAQLIKNCSCTNYFVEISKKLRRNEQAIKEHMHVFYIYHSLECQCGSQS